jgi:hypothetical protein
MSLKSVSLLVVAAITLHQSSSAPSIRFAELGQQKDNLISAFGGFKAELFRPLGGVLGAKAALLRWPAASPAQYSAFKHLLISYFPHRQSAGLVGGLAGAKVGLVSGLAGAKLGLVGGLAGAKLGLAKGLLRPVAGIKRGGLTMLRGLIDSKIQLLDGF